jgi:hypothetical protein
MISRIIRQDRGKPKPKDITEIESYNCFVVHLLFTLRLLFLAILKFSDFENYVLRDIKFRNFRVIYLASVKRRYFGYYAMMKEVQS